MLYSPDITMSPSLLPKLAQQICKGVLLAPAFLHSRIASGSHGRSRAPCARRHWDAAQHSLCGQSAKCANPWTHAMTHWATTTGKQKASVSVVLLLLKAEQTQAAELLRINLGVLRDNQYTGSSRLCSGHLSRQLSETEH